MNLYGYANGDPVNYSDPFGLYAERQGGDESANADCLPNCAADVINALAQLAPAVEQVLQAATVVVLSPVIVVAAAEVGTAAGVQQAAKSATTAVARTATYAEGQAARSGATAFAAGMAEGAGRAFIADNGNKSLPAAAPAPNIAWGAGRAVGMGLYYATKIMAAQHGLLW